MPKYNLICLLLFAIISTGCVQSNHHTTSHQYTGQTHMPTLIQQAKAGNANAQYQLAYHYYSGDGVPVNRSLAQEWMQAAANRGQPQAIAAMRNPHDWQVPDNDYIARYHPKPLALPPAPSNRHEFTDLLAGQTERSRSHFTLGLFKTKDEQSAKAFIRQHDLDSDAEIRRITSKNKTTYEVTYGKYRNAKQARSSIKDLPEDLKNLRPSVQPNEQFDTSFQTNKEALFPEKWHKHAG